MTAEKWVTEAAHGFGTTIKITGELYSARSKFQKIEIFDTEKVGRMMLLDGIIQLTEYDEFAYQEMMAHVPLFAHPDPKHVLVIGGGDGGVLREVVKHPGVETIDICEIDSMVIDACRKFLPSLACGYDDPRVCIHVADGNEFVRDRQGFYDVIIVDSTDPVGPGEILFGEEFYRRMKRSLRPGGVIASQSESLFLHPAIVKRLLSIAGTLFCYSGYAIVYVPTYPTGSIGVCVASDGRDVRVPARETPESLQKQLRYYTENLHRAAFVLPYFGEELLKKELRS